MALSTLVRTAIIVGCAGAAEAQTSEVTVPVGSLECLVEHRQKYLDLPRNVIIFFPSLCPAVSREEVAAIVQNSAADSGPPETRSIMLKSEFACLVDRISAELDSAAALPAEPDSAITFTLDCG